MSKEIQILSASIRECQICAKHFDHEPKPIFQIGANASILIAGQAPGRKAHASGIPFSDPSGDRLRSWLGISPEVFYDADRISLVPMGFCYPGHGRSGDLPPRPECAQTWREAILTLMPNLQLRIVIGKYAIQWHLGDSGQGNVTETIRAWKSYAPGIIPLPHPSPRNNLWLRRNPWFESEVIPALRDTVTRILDNEKSDIRGLSVDAQPIMRKS